MNELKSNLIRLMNEYAGELAEARRTENFKRPFGALVRKDIAGIIRQSLDPTIYSVKGSVGAGRWTDVPWIAVFDKRITSSAQKGVYLVYLLNKDSKTLYLTLNQGATDISQRKDGVKSEKLAFTGIASTDNAKTTGALKERGNRIRDLIGNPYHLAFDDIDSGSKAYDAGCVFYKRYTPGTIPDDSELIRDLKIFIDLYGTYYEKVYGEDRSDQEDSFEEPDRTEETWEESGEDMEISDKDAIHQIKKYIASKGFSYNEGLIENFFLSIKSKPFVILAGTSGTGKTRLVKLFAEAIGAHYKLVPVRPDWSDSSDLFGHLDLNGKYIPGEVLDFLCEAQNNLKDPYIICLDEMNLARVEYYLSDILSVLETRDLKDGIIVSAPLISETQYGSDREAANKYGTIGFPQNLYIVGTVNMDETTFPFSKKVLDRANTIEFNYVDLIPAEYQGDREIKTLKLSNSFLKTRYLLLYQCDNREYVEKICSELQSINQVLQKGNAHIGYRVRDEIVFYMLNNLHSELLEENEALDNEIMQKILPRIQGSSSLIKELLCELFMVFAGDYEGYQTQSDDIASKMLKKLQDTGARFRKSAEKTAFMIRRFEEDGFTSYWL
ncbi:MAG: DUF3578 domain-containing protein [Lachnospiraceae bacterium]|nr:DUF3578 domain-containing protein [Lachnospiraceae bacterium]